MIHTYDPSLPRDQRRLEVTLPNDLPDQAVITIHGLLYEILWAFEHHYCRQINTHYAFGCVYDEPDESF